MATKKASSSKRKSAAKNKSADNQKTTTKISTVSATTAGKKLTKTFSLPSDKTSLVAALVAEFIGTFLLAASYIAGQGQPLYILFALVGIVLFIGAISGAHVNPAVTIGAWVTKKIKAVRALSYIVVQFLGAAMALIVLGAFVGGAEEVSAEAALYGQTAASLFAASALPEGKEWYVFFSEILGTLVLGFAFASVFSKRKDRTSSAFTIGLGLFVALLIAYTGSAYVGGTAILNPAVALSLDALSWQVWPLAVYILGPILGGVIGFVLYNIIGTKNNNKDEITE